MKYLRLLAILSVVLLVGACGTDGTNNAVSMQGHCPSCGEVIDTSFDNPDSIITFKTSTKMNPSVETTENVAVRATTGQPGLTNEMDYQIITPVVIGGVPLMALVDTGSTVNVIGQRTFNRLNKSNMLYLGDNQGSSITTIINLSFYQVWMNHGGIRVNSTLGVVADDDLILNADMILGLPTMQKLGITIDTARAQVSH